MGTHLVGLKYWMGTATILLLIAPNIGWALAPVPPYCYRPPQANRPVEKDLDKIGHVLVRLDSNGKDKK